MPDAWPQVEIFGDGGCRGNPGPGAWAAILRHEKGEREIGAASAHTTNNRMEIAAAIESLRLLRQPCSVTFTSDSQYLVKGMKEWLPQWRAKHWRNSNRRVVLNVDLWQELDRIAQPHRIQWVWVRGHDGHDENERCDDLLNGLMDRVMAGEKPEDVRLDRWVRQA